MDVGRRSRACHLAVGALVEHQAPSRSLGLRHPTRSRNRVLSHRAHQHRAIKEAEPNPGRFNEVLWKAYGNMDSPRHICRTLNQFYSPIELENLVKSSSCWRERSLPWNSEGLRDSVDRFVGNYSGDKNIELAFVEISVGGITKCL